MDYFIVGIGGLFGSIARYSLGRLIMKNRIGKFPFGTFAVNIIGAILLGIISSIDSSGNSYIFAADGFLGAFTTFSTFMYEGAGLIQKNQLLSAAVYVALSLILGIIGYTAGFMLFEIIL